jgi:hypothetical protein
MPRGPKGEKRPADVNARAVMIAKIATGDVDDTLQESSKRKAGSKGGPARARALTPEQRSKIAHLAAEARWKKKR